MEGTSLAQEEAAENPGDNSPPSNRLNTSIGTPVADIPPLPQPPASSGSKMVQRYLHDLDAIISKRKHMLSDLRHRGSALSGGANSLHKKKIRRTEVSDAMDQSNDEIFGRRVLNLGTAADSPLADPALRGELNTSTLHLRHAGLINAVSEGSPHYSPQSTHPPSIAEATSGDGVAGRVAALRKTFEKVDDNKGMATVHYENDQLNIGTAPSNSRDASGSKPRGEVSPASEMEASLNEMETEDLLNHLRVAEAKTLLLKDKVMEMEDQLEVSYLEHSERAKSLTTEVNRLESQRAELEEELVTTKEELLFIRAQLQNKSARISELEFDLLTAQRRVEDMDALVTASAEAGSTESEQLQNLDDENTDNIIDQIDLPQIDAIEHQNLLEENMQLARYLEDAQKSEALAATERNELLAIIAEMEQRQIESDGHLFQAEMRLAEMELQLLSRNRSHPEQFKVSSKSEEDINVIQTTGTAPAFEAPESRGDTSCMLILMLMLQIALWVTILLFAATYMALINSRNDLCFNSPARNDKNIFTVTFVKLAAIAGWRPDGVGNSITPFCVNTGVGWDLPDPFRLAT